jgi:hypothetical protein
MMAVDADQLFTNGQLSSDLMHPGYQPHSSECKVSTRANQELKHSTIPKPFEGKKTCIGRKKKLAIPKYCSISTI